MRGSGHEVERMRNDVRFFISAAAGSQNRQIAARGGSRTGLCLSSSIRGTVR